MMSKAEVLQLYQGVPIGRNGLVISHLQFIDNTMIFYKPQHQNLINAKRVLRCFQLVCSLKNNFHKSSLIGIGVDDQLVRRRAGRIACRIGELPSVYLGRG